MSSPVTCQDFPADWEKREHFIGSGKFGEVWEARRRDSDGVEIRRVIRVLPVADENLREQLLLHLAKLSNLALPYVSLPDRVWPLVDGRIAFAVQRHNRPLTVLLQDAQGLGKHLDTLPCWTRRAASYVGCDVGDVRVERLLGQVLRGLAELHGQNIVHGDVRPRNIFVDGAEPDGETAWLGDAAIGPLAYWSEGRMRDPEAEHYYPPEWNGVPQKPSPQADLFALGLTFCELVLGTDANPRRAGDAHKFDASTRSSLLQQLAEHGISRRARRVVGAMLEPDDSLRPNSATDVFKRWEQQHRPSRWEMLPWWVAAALLVLLMPSWAAKSRHIAELDAQVQKLDADSKNIAAQRDGLLAKDEKIQNLKDELVNRLEGVAQTLDRIEAKTDGIPKPTGEPGTTVGIPASPTELAKEQWKAALEKTKKENPEATYWALLGKQIEAIEDLFKKVPPELTPGHRKRLTDWLIKRKNLRDAVTDADDAEKWAAHDTDFKKLLRAAVEQPWEDETEEAKARIYVLNSARKKWADWASKGSMSWDELTEKISNVSDDGERALLTKWSNDFVSRRASFTMKLTSGKSDAWALQRNVYVYGSTMKTSGWHRWDTEASNSYQGKNIDSVTFGWNPGKPLRVVLEAERSLSRGWAYNPNLIDYTFRGPLAVWEANRCGRIGSGNRNLLFEIKNCPGPPP